MCDNQVNDMATNTKSIFEQLLAGKCDSKAVDKVDKNEDGAKVPADNLSDSIDQAVKGIKVFLNGAKVSLDVQSDFFSVIKTGNTEQITEFCNGQKNSQLFKLFASIARPDITDQLLSRTNAETQEQVELSTSNANV